MTGCPKAMVHGPCGGVTPDGGCEVADLACAFVGDGAVAAPAVAPRTGAVARTPAAQDLLDLAARRPLVVADLAAPPLDADALREAAAAVAGHLDAALLGDAPWARVQLPPAVRAQLVATEGVRPWASLTCRDRNRVALEGELAALRALGDAGAVHCVTGDHPLLGHRPDAAPVFDLDSTRLATLAAGTGLLVSVAETPAAPPVPGRAGRAIAKVAAGADVVVVNHTPDHDLLADFVARLRALAPEVLVLACVPLAISEAGRQRLAAFGADPVGDGVRAAVHDAEDLLAIEGVDGVDLSAAAGPGEELQVAAALALAGAELGVTA